VTARSKVWAAAAHLLGLCIESRRGKGFLSLVNIVCGQVVVSATGRTIVQRGPIECYVSRCDRKVWPNTGFCALKKFRVETKVWHLFQKLYYSRI
jgi:hypothetical protein